MVAIVCDFKNLLTVNFQRFVLLLWKDWLGWSRSGRWFFVRRFFIGCTGIRQRCSYGWGSFLLLCRRLWWLRFADLSHQCRTFFGRCAGNGCDLSSGRFYLASKDFLTGAGNSFFGGIHALGKLLSPFYKAVIDTVFIGDSSTCPPFVNRLAILASRFFKVTFLITAMV